MQPRSAFGQNRAQPDGLQNYCKPCQRKANSKWQKANPEKGAAKARRLRKELKARDPHKAWAQRRNQRLKAEYGITLDQYNYMLAKQNSRCAICTGHEAEFPKKLVVDHCHQSGRVRKLLCGLCNQLLGSAKENTSTLHAAVKYLEEHK